MELFKRRPLALCCFCAVVIMACGLFMNSFSIIDKISNKFDGQIPNLIFFAIGILLGIILFLITFLIVSFISKSKVNNEEELIESKTNEEYKTIIETKKDQFTSLYKNSSIKEKHTVCQHYYE